VKRLSPGCENEGSSACLGVGIDGGLAERGVGELTLALPQGAVGDQEAVARQPAAREKRSAFLQRLKIGGRFLIFSRVFSPFQRNVH